MKPIRSSSVSAFSLFFFFSSLVLFSLSAFANGGEDELTAGTLKLESQQGNQITAPIVDTNVSIAIAGLTARVKVVQSFKNETPYWMEGIYLFPLPEKSAVDTLKMKIGERIIIGEIKEKQAAKKIYQQAKISGKKASLVEQHRPNVFSNKVANIAPFETIEITIEYQQEIKYQRDTGFSIRFPMTMTPRYTPSVKLVESFDDLSQGMINTPTFFENMLLPQKDASELGNDVHISVALDSGLTLEYLTSDSHKLQKTQVSESNFQLKLAGYNNKADRDFILKWKPLAGSEPRAALFNESIGDEYFTSIMIMPPSEDQTDTSELQGLDREVIFVLDTSGSMAGESLKQAKSALLSGLGTLQNSDKFNVIEFNSSTNKLYSSARPFTLQTRQQAVSFVSSLRADGGTEMLGAMDAALDGSTNKNLVRQVIFLTDGAISNESELFKIIDRKLGSSRLFTVGIGSAPNEFFMKRAAAFGKGKATFIADISQSKIKINKLFEQISSPLLSHINLNWPSSLQVEMWPNKIPDLFPGEPLWIKAKLVNPDNSQSQVIDNLARLNIDGRLPDSLWQSEIPLAKGKSQTGIAKLWAREKIASIMNDSHHGRLQQSQKDLITQTALKHHLVSRFTSLVAVDKTPSRIAEELHQAKIKQVKPKGTASKTVGYPKTALNLFIGPKWSLFLLLLSAIGLLTLKIFDRKKINP